MHVCVCVWVRVCARDRTEHCTLCANNILARTRPNRAMLDRANARIRTQSVREMNAIGKARARGRGPRINQYELLLIFE